MRFLGSYRGLALKLGHDVTLGTGSNLAGFRVVSLKNKFSAIFYSP